MAGRTPQSSNPNGFVVPDGLGYAMTEMEICEAAEFLMTKLEQVNLDDLDPNDRKCAICQEEYHVSTNVTLSHAPVKTTCGHIFGDKCIIEWLDPLCFYRKESNEGSAADMDAPLFRKSKTSCPICRFVFFPEQFELSLPSLKRRLWFWDTAYATAEVALSDKEERTRKYLRQYVEYCELFEDNGESVARAITGDLALLDTQFNLLGFAHWLKSQTLTAAQESRREKLEQIGKMDMTHLRITGYGTFNLDSSRDEETDDEQYPDSETGDEEEIDSKPETHHEENIETEC